MLSQFSEKTDKSKWLPTHLWHAKRFHVVDKYGWKVPYTPTQKCTRHSYHSIAKNCAVIDTSYQSIYQLSSDNQPLLLQTLSPILLPSLSLSPHLHSLTPVTTTMFYPNAYPYGAIGPVSILPISVSSVWLLLHPAMVSEFVALSNKFPDQMECSDITAEVGVLQLVGPSSLSTLLKALPPDLDTEQGIGAWYKSCNNSPELFALLEKMSQSSQLRLPDNSLLGYTASDPRLSLPTIKIPVRLEDPEPDELMALLTKLQDQLQTAGTQEVPFNTEADATTESDTTPINNTDIIVSFESHRQTLASSQLCVTHCRHQSVADRHTDHVINTHRSKCFTGHAPEDPRLQKNRVPLWLLTTSGSHGPLGSTSQYGAGVLLMLPREWVLTSLVALSYWGAKAVGKKELDRVWFERQSMCYPIDCIDTNGYVIEAYNKKRELEKSYLLKPPDKRVEYGKMGVSTPFHSPWGSLVGGALDQMECDSSYTRLPYFLLRDRQAILSLQHVLFKRHMPYKYLPRYYKLRYPCKKLPLLSQPLSLSEILEKYSNSVLLVSVHMLLRGSVEERAKLFLPTEEDIQVITSNFSKNCVERDLSVFSITESNRLGITKVDIDRQLITGVSVHSEEVLKSARKSLKRCRKTLNELHIDTPRPALLSSCLFEPSVSSLENLGMRPLPPDSRDCCGYVTSGDYSFCRGYSTGLACISLSSLLKLIQTQRDTRLPPLLLSRNPSGTRLTPALIVLTDSPSF